MHKDVADSFYDALLDAPSEGRIFVRLIPKGSEEIAPNFYDAFSEDYRRVCEEWREKNALVRGVLNKQTTFTEEIEKTILGSYGPEAIRIIEECVGKVSTTINPSEQARKYGGLGVLCGGGTTGGFAYLYPYHRDIDLEEVVSRRNYIKWMTIAGASLWGIAGGLFGYYGSKHGRHAYREIASNLDHVIDFLYLDDSS